MGKFVPPGKRVTIENGGPFDRRFETNDMAIAYQYRVCNQTVAHKTRKW